MNCDITSEHHACLTSHIIVSHEVLLPLPAQLTHDEAPAGWISVQRALLCLCLCLSVSLCLYLCLYLCICVFVTMSDSQVNSTNIQQLSVCLHFRLNNTMCHCHLMLNDWVQSFLVAYTHTHTHTHTQQGLCVAIVTHVPRTSLKSKIFLMSSTCFFQDPSLDSPFSFAISHQGLEWEAEEGEEEEEEEEEEETLLEDQHHRHRRLTHKEKRKRKSSALLFLARGFLAARQRRLSRFLSPMRGGMSYPREVIWLICLT